MGWGGVGHEIEVMVEWDTVCHEIQIPLEFQAKLTSVFSEFINRIVL